MSFTRNLSCVTFDYDIDGIKLERPATFRDLGIVFDPKLTFSSHIQTIAGEALRTLGFIIRNSRDFVSVNTLKILYCSFVRSKLEYASLVWCPNYNIHINTLENIQRRFLKLLYFRSHGVYPPVGYSHCDLLNEFAFLSLNARREYFSQIFLYKIIHNNLDCPPILTKLNLSVPRENSRQTRTFHLEVARTNLLQNSPLHFMCRIHNRICSNVDIFNTSLNNLKSYFNGFQ